MVWTVTISLLGRNIARDKGHYIIMRIMSQFLSLGVVKAKTENHKSIIIVADFNLSVVNQADQKMKEDVNTKKHI